ncbi:MAG: biotin/lipoyl-binding protein [Verrucomicrobia bacterium]|nr:MAG: biotin/lipoyl-binding protein [Verrucomicrobiota bacterium]
MATSQETTTQPHDSAQKPEDHQRIYHPKSHYGGWIMPSLGLLCLIFAVLTVLHLKQVRLLQPPPHQPPSPSNHEYEIVAGVGLIEPTTENISLSVPMSGLITNVYVKAGELVKRGQELFSLDDRDAQANVAVKKAQLSVDQNNITAVMTLVSKAEINQEASDKLGQNHVINENEVKLNRVATANAQANLASAQSQLQLATAQLQQAQTALELLHVRSPIDGTVLQCHARMGQYASSAANTDPLMILGNIDDLNVRVNIDEQDAWRVQPDAKAYAELRGSTAARIELQFIRFEPYVIPKIVLTGNGHERTDVRVLQVIYRITNRDSLRQLHLFSGQQVDVYIQENPLKKESPTPNPEPHKTNAPIK